MAWASRSLWPWSARSRRWANCSRKVNVAFFFFFFSWTAAETDWSPSRTARRMSSSPCLNRRIPDEVLSDSHQGGGLGRGQIGGIPRITPGPELAHLGRDHRPLGRREVPPVEVPAEDQLGGGARVSLEAHHPGLQPQLLAGPIPVQPVQDLALVQRDGLALSVLPDVLLEGGELRLGHRGKDQRQLVGLITGDHRVPSWPPSIGGAEFFHDTKHMTGACGRPAAALAAPRVVLTARRPASMLLSQKTIGGGSPWRSSSTTSSSRLAIRSQRRAHSPACSTSRGRSRRGRSRRSPSTTRSPSTSRIGNTSRTTTTASA